MVYFPRDVDRALLEWSESKDRKPLILRGARQTGKTASVRSFGSSFDLFVELNLERFEDLAKREEDVLFSLAAPMVLRNKLIGVINLGSTGGESKDHFTDYDLRMATIFAQHASVVDLDGPLLLARDRDPGIRYDGSIMQPPPRALWG